MAAAGKQSRQRHQLRASLHDGMGPLWDYVMSHPERSRVHALIYIASLGADFRVSALQGAGSSIPLAQAPSRPSATAAAPASEPAAADRPRSLDPDGRGAAMDDMAGWDFSDSFDSVAPMQ